MRKHIPSMYVMVCGIGLILSCASHDFAQAPADPLDRVLADWLERQNQTKSVRYQMSGEIFYPQTRLDGVDPGLVGRTKPVKDHTGPVKLELAFDFDKGLTRKERTADLPFQGGYFARTEIRVFDGSSAKTYQLKNASEDERLIINRDLFTQTMGGLLEGCDYPVFFAHGIVPNANAHIDAKQPRTAYVRGDYVFIGKATHEKRECLVVHTAPSKSPANLRHEFWVDPTQNSAIVHWKFFIGDLLSAEANIRYGQTKHGWLPDQWTSSCYFSNPGNNNLNYSQKLKVTECAVNQAIGGKEFQIPLKPGLRVCDVQLMEDFVVAADGKTLVTQRPR